MRAAAYTRKAAFAWMAKAALGKRATARLAPAWC